MERYVLYMLECGDVYMMVGLNKALKCTSVQLENCYKNYMLISCVYVT